MSEDKYEMVDQPSHYQSKINGLTASDVIDSWDLNFNLGCAVKYILRAGKKPNTPAYQDYLKTEKYLQREINRCADYLSHLQGALIALRREGE